MREKAAQVLEAYAEDRIEAVTDILIRRGQLQAINSQAGEALKEMRSWRGFALQIAASVTASIILALIIWFYVQTQS